MAEQTLDEGAGASILFHEDAVLVAELIGFPCLDVEFALKLANILWSSLADVNIIKKLVLTLSPRTEGASRHLVSQLATLFRAQPFSFLGSQQPLVLVHVLLILLGANNMWEKV